MNDIAIVMQAAAFAAAKHARQRRKGEAGEPYINHLIEVAALAAQATDDRDVVVAALLHDAVEDQGVTRQEIAAQFGEKVARLVAEVTDDKNLEKQERKRLQIVNAPHKSEGACILKLADKTSNLRALAASPPPWPRERKRDYLAWARDVVAGLPIKPTGLHAEFAKAGAELERMLG